MDSRSDEGNVTVFTAALASAWTVWLSVRRSRAQRSSSTIIAVQDAAVRTTDSHSRDMNPEYRIIYISGPRRLDCFQ
jgi:hypothetical protein